MLDTALEAADAIDENAEVALYVLVADCAD